MGSRSLTPRDKRDAAGRALIRACRAINAPDFTVAEHIYLALAHENLSADECAEVARMFDVRAWRLRNPIDRT